MVLFGKMFWLGLKFIVFVILLVICLIKFGLIIFNMVLINVRIKVILINIWYFFV